MSRARWQIAALWSVSVWPALNFLHANWVDVLRGGWLSVWGVIAFVVGVGLCAHILYRLLRERGEYLVVVWVAGMGMFFGYMAVRGFFIALLRGLPWNLPPSFGWLVCFALILFAAYRWRKSADLQNAATTFSLVAGAAAASMLLFTMTTTASAVSDAVVPDLPHRQGQEKPVNVYYVILDAYGGRHALQALGFDNSSFLARMRARGLRELSTDRSNYLKTAQTVGALFSLDYTFTAATDASLDNQREYPQQFDGAQPPALIAALKAEGYEVWFSDTVLTGCPPHHVSCLRTTLAVDSGYMLQTFLATTPVWRLLMRWMNDRRDAISPLVDQLDSLLASSRPLFVFAHHLAPHPPFTLDASCKPRLSWESGWAVPTQNDREGYLESLRCVNRRVELLVDRIIARDLGAIIVVQSDHGPGLAMRWEAPMSTWTEAEILDRASYLNLVRVPERCARALDHAMGQVNTARFVLGCVQGRPPEYLPEKTFLSTYFSGSERGLIREWHPPTAAVASEAAASP